MTRRNVEMDLPASFVTKHGPVIHGWLESAIPGSQLAIPTGGALASPFVSSSSIERNTVTLRAVDLASVSGAVLLVEPADAHSRRLVAEAA
jgi:hypothetical protein